MYLLSSVLLLEFVLSAVDGFIVNGAQIKQSKADDDARKNVSWTSVRSDEGHSGHVPQFMLDLYKHLSDKRWSPKFDTARSYSKISSDIYKMNDALLSGQLTSQYQVTEVRTILFSISHFPAREQIQLAQLRLFIESHKNRNNYDFDDSTKLVLHVFSRNGYKHSPYTPRYIDIHGGYCETFNVTQIVTQWLTDKTSREQKFEIHISRPSKSFKSNFINYEGDNAPHILVLSKTLSAVRDYEGHHLLRSRRSLENKLQNFQLANLKFTASNSASTNVLENNELIKSELIHMIVKRSEDEELEEQEEQSNYIMEDVSKVKKGKSKRRRNHCRRKPLHVNFAAINYDQWIIAPPSYEAFECTGKCTFPISAHLAPTKHAVIQTLMHSLQPKQVSRACCVPIKLEPISVLYVDDDGTVTYKYEYEDMVITECGCR